MSCRSICLSSLFSFSQPIFESLVVEHQYIVVFEVVYSVQFDRFLISDPFEYHPNEETRYSLALIYSTDFVLLNKLINIMIQRKRIDTNSSGHLSRDWMSSFYYYCLMLLIWSLFYLGLFSVNVFSVIQSCLHQSAF